MDPKLEIKLVKTFKVSEICTYGITCILYTDEPIIRISCKLIKSQRLAKRILIIVNETEPQLLTLLQYSPSDPVIIEEMDRSDYNNSVIGLSYTFVMVTENKRISLVDTNVNIVC